MSIVFGNFIEADDNDEYLSLTFFGKDYSLQERWRNNGISADFLADYWMTFFSAAKKVSLDWQNEIKGTISYVANELLENTIKFRELADKYPVHFRVLLSRQLLRFYVTNSISTFAAQRFQAYIRNVLANNPADLYVQQLEQNALNNDNSISRLGLLTLLNDYHVELAWKFEEFDEPLNMTTVTVMAMLRLPFEV